MWSAAQLCAADAKRRMRLPRARSSPNSRHWMLNRDAGAAAASTLTHEAPRGWSSRVSLCARPDAAAADPPPSKVCHGSLTTGQQPQHSNAETRGADRHRTKSDLAQAAIKQAELRHPRQTKAVFCATGDIPLLSERANKILLGKETTKLSIPRHSLESFQRVQVQEPLAACPEAFVPLKTIHRSPNSGTKELSRKLSLPSEEAMRRLGELDASLVDVEQRVEQLSRLAAEPAKLAAESVGKIRAALAQLEAEANKLETKGVDSIYTSELKSGQVSAKECKKSQLRRLERIFGVIDDVFRRLNE